MPAVSEFYGIPGPVPFVDVEINADNRLYIDPHAVRLRRSELEFVDEAVDALDSFFGEVTGCVIDGSTSERRRGEDLLQHFVEPWETRLGMATRGFRGHGGASEVGTRIWDTLTDDVEALVRVGVLRQLEDLPLFVDGIDRDITSDVTTRVIYSALARFTASMIQTYPQFTAAGHEVREIEKQVWDPSSLRWTTSDVLLPMANGKELLLVPDGWARRTLLMSAVRFYETSVLSYAQLEQAAILSDGTLAKTPKDLLKQQPDLGRGRETITRVTKRAIGNEDDLLARFKSFVASRLAEDDRGAAAT
ncbi:hypothetical protein C5C31_13925 [Rathayibacter rathayi]|uniref:hypothetical protein n=1 Tax=Rathayibacter rathayi TaxID=33887 RepID=UPI000CE923CF|nr:hypothetical protein [Rathayibacter rathayi]PPG67756.1 hypothetical protein C5C02_09220 [Rathayibacter rathayi]PPG75571.1 hypothetical protein C5C23_09865 [Rathayibacter rathayi]PPH18480.1 hypothetical protein C5C31_13925 [Rathayibacter rathayi]PPI75532.1 hypothetical protein C5E03_13710 [Rathayibacter rathayi]